MCAPNELMSTGTERSTDAAATSSNSMIVVSQSSAMPPPSSLTTPEMRPNSVSLRTIAPIFSRGTNWSRYSLLKIGSASAARKRRRLSTAAACSSVLITCPMSAPVSGGLLLGEDRDRDHGFLDAVEAAAVFLDGDARIAHLARARFTAQLRHELVDLAQAGGADRMAFRFEAARRVDRHAAADRQLAALGRRAAFAERHQQQRLDVEDLAHRRGVVHFGDVDVAWRDAGFRIGLLRRQVGNDLGALVDAARAAGLDHAREHAHGAARRAVEAFQAGGVAEHGRRDAYSIEQVLASPPIAYPLTMLMCSPISDGAAAAVLCNAAGLKRLNGAAGRAMRVLSSVIQT